MLDLNLLRIFIAVMEEGTLTAAATRLALTQPSVTHAINRLRRSTGDELFQRSGRGVIPTRAARQLYAEIAGLPDAAEAAISRLRGFHPPTTMATFRVAMTDLGQQVFLPRLVPALGDAAPYCDLEVVELDTTTAASHLLEGSLDLAIASTAPSGAAPSHPLRLDRYVCVARRGRLGPQPPTKDEIAGTARIVIHGRSGHTLVESHLPAPAPGSIHLSGFAAIPALLAQTDLVAFVPQAIVPPWADSWDIEQWPLPYEHMETTVHAYTSPRPLPAATSWFVPWAIEQLRDPPFAPESAPGNL